MAFRFDSVDVVNEGIYFPKPKVYGGMSSTNTSQQQS